MTRSEQWAEIWLLSIAFGVKTYPRSDMPSNMEGLAYVPEEVVEIRLETACPLFIFLHEVGHIYAARREIYAHYHLTTHFWNEDTVRKWRNEALAAELWVDQWARNEVEVRYPQLDISDLTGYLSPEVQKWFSRSRDREADAAIAAIRTWQS